MADSRAEILAAVRRGCTARAPLPLVEPAGGAAPPDLAQRFAQACEAAGGRCLCVAGPEAIAAALEALPEIGRARRVYSVHPDVPGARFAAEELGDPRRLAGLEAAVLPGALGVAENGAVWVPADELVQRRALFLAEHLLLVLPRAALEPDLAAAYARLDFSRPGFGVFVAGPSKTADIEQALVIGAQGPRSTTVLLVGESG